MRGGGSHQTTFCLSQETVRIIVDELLLIENIHLRVLKELHSTSGTIIADNDFFRRFLGHPSKSSSDLIVFKNLLLLLRLIIAYQEL
jgi:hypothetical protein